MANLKSFVITKSKSNGLNLIQILSDRHYIAWRKGGTDALIIILEPPGFGSMPCYCDDCFNAFNRWRGLDQLLFDQLSNIGNLVRISFGGPDENSTEKETQIHWDQEYSEYRVVPKEDNEIWRTLFL